MVSSLLGPVRYSAALELDLRRMNPWWARKPGRVLPPTRRHFADEIQRRIDANVAPVVLVRGPRQVGKTTAVEQIVHDLLQSGVAARRILHVQFDEIGELRRLGDPILRIADWFEQEILGGTLNEYAARGEPAYIFLDEVQNLDGWAPQLKSLVDHSTVHVVVTRSSALRLEIGRDSLSGRLTTIETGPLSLTEVARLRGIDLGEPLLPYDASAPDLLSDEQFWRAAVASGATRHEPRDEAFRWFSEFGGYPLAHRSPGLSWPTVRSQLTEDVVRRVIEHDLRLGDRGRKRDGILLSELFRLACRYAGQCPTKSELAQQLRDSMETDVTANTVGRYLEFLHGTMLLRLVRPLEIRLKKTKGAPKIALVDHGVRAAVLNERATLTPGVAFDAMIAGRVAESVVGSMLGAIQDVTLTHRPGRKRSGEPEIDFVVDVGDRLIPVEVKYRSRIDPGDTVAGMEQFMEQHRDRAPFGVVVTMGDDVTGADRIANPRIVTIPLASLLLFR